MGAFQNIQRKHSDYANVFIQPALEIGKEDDEYEKEADSVANKVMKMPDSSGSVQKMNDEEKEETKMAEGGEKIQMMKDSPLKINKMSAGSNAGLKASPKVEQSINHSKGKGQSLDAGLQSELGHKMGANFSEVKIHTDENAAQMNKEVGAKAFTHGNDIYFNSGQYNPSTNPGKHLLTHELTHTIQQKGNVQRKIQRDIIDSGMKVNGGEFSINMLKKEIPPETKVGEKGTISFKPDPKYKVNDKEFNSNEIRLFQIARGTTIIGGVETTDPKGADRPDLTSAQTKKYETKEKDTLKIISDSYNGHITSKEIYDANSAALGAFDENKEIAAKTVLNIPAVREGYFLDHLPNDPIATPRTNKTDKDVPLFYREYAPNASESQDGYKKSETDTQDASLWDFPGWGSSTGKARWYFETVARSVDKSFDYGTIYWGFTTDKGLVTDEYHHVNKGASPTSKSAIAKFNTYYKNHHIVMAGETLWSIAEWYFGDGNKYKDIQKANNMKETDTNINPGDKLIIPTITNTDAP